MFTCMSSMRHKSSKIPPKCLPLIHFHLVVPVNHLVIRAIQLFPISQAWFLGLLNPKPLSLSKNLLLTPSFFILGRILSNFVLRNGKETLVTDILSCFERDKENTALDFKLDSQIIGYCIKELFGNLSLLREDSLMLAMIITILRRWHCIKIFIKKSLVPSKMLCRSNPHNMDGVYSKKLIQGSFSVNLLIFL